MAEAQNSSEQIIPSTGIEGIEIRGNQIFQIDVTTHNLPEVQILSQIDGEYQEEFQVTTSIENGILLIQLEQNPTYTIPDDKRNAHKVLAAVLKLRTQTGLDIDIESDIASVTLKGEFNRLGIILSQGYCYLNGNAKLADIKTIDGSIKIVTSKGKVYANSRYGNISLNALTKESSVWNLSSIYGAIEVSKLQE